MTEEENRRAAEKLARKLLGEKNSSPDYFSRHEGRSTRTRWSGAGPDNRDPQLFNDVFHQVQKKKGWDIKMAEGKLFSQWTEIVGKQNAAKSSPEKLVEGKLYVQTESTAWATQLRLMHAHILEKIAAAVGKDIVRTLVISGPKGPSWRKGERHVRGRGPRDTYG